MKSQEIKQQLFKDLDDLLDRLEIERRKKDEIIFTLNRYMNDWELEINKKVN